MRNYTIPAGYAKKHGKSLTKIMGSSFDADENGKSATGSFDSDRDFEKLEDYLILHSIPFDRFIDTWEDGVAYYRIYRSDRPGRAYDRERQVLDEGPENIAVSLKEIKDILDSQKTEEEKVFTLECFINSRAFPPYTKIEEISM